jgi:hypothetical protein
MASATIVISKIKLDKVGVQFANGKDVDTNQYLTIYPRKDLRNGFFADVKAGQTAVFFGTVHPIGNNAKIIATSFKVVS